MNLRKNGEIGSGNISQEKNSHPLTFCVCVCVCVETEAKWRENCVFFLQNPSSVSAVQPIWKVLHCSETDMKNHPKIPQHLLAKHQASRGLAGSHSLRSIYRLHQYRTSIMAPFHPASLLWLVLRPLSLHLLCRSLEPSRFSINRLAFQISKD